MQIPLSGMHPGQTGTIVSIGDTGALRQRLIAMGVTPGAEVQLRKFAPLGDPMEIRIRSFELSIRRLDAAQIFIDLRETGL